MTASALTALTHGRLNPALLAQVSDEVAKVEEELDLQVRSQVELVERVSRHTLQAGGKRLRPAFVSLAAKATGLEFSAERAILMGTCMEMIHMATLIHDDVIDNSATRRGRPTASAEFGNTAAILSGDVLLAKAMMLLAKDCDLDIIRTVSNAVVDMSEGEVRELEARGDFDLDEPSHMEILRLKTASFIECCCEVGAMLAGASPEVVTSLRRYGYHVGMAFQIIDDLLDYRGDKVKTGKPRATDFREGQATLPLIFLRPHLSESESKIVRRKFGNSPNEDEIRMLSDWMESRGAYSRAEQEARAHTERALVSLSALPESSPREILETVAEFVMRREA